MSILVNSVYMMQCCVFFPCVCASLGLPVSRKTKYFVHGKLVNDDKNNVYVQENCKPLMVRSSPTSCQVVFLVLVPGV